MSASASLASDADTQRLYRIYRTSLIARAVDEALWALSRMGRASFVLTARGHEIAQAASAAALRLGHDSAWPYYRDLAVGLALGVTPYEIFLGAMARADDPHSGGRQLTAHFSSTRLRIGSVSSEVAAHIPHATGAAYASKVIGSDSVAVCWFGDGATSEGMTHEAMNLAAVRRLPVVFICENNGIAISVPLGLQMPVRSVAERASAYAMPGRSVDGMDATAVFDATRTAVDLARSGGGPSLLELRVRRMTAHSSQDDDRYRTDADRAEASAADPLPPLRRLLIDAGVLTDQSDTALRGSIARRVEDDQERAWRRPEPEGERARRWLFAGDPPHAPGAPLPVWENVFES